MAASDIAVATMTLARDDEEAELIVGALTTLSRGGFRVAVVDGGSPVAFVDRLRSLPGLEVHALPDGERGLVPQIRRSLAIASSWQPRRLFYTEPDKASFFAEHFDGFLQTAMRMPNAAIVLACRSAAALTTFPPSQQRTEAMASALCADATSFRADFLYGPFLLDPALAQFVQDLPSELAWGWRTFLFAFAHARGFRLEAVTGDFICPEAQRHDGPPQRLLRMTQLSQNVAGLALALRRSMTQ